MKRPSKPSVSASLAALAGALAFAAAPSTAHAQQSGYTADRLINGVNPDDGIAVWRPYMADRTRFFADLTVDYIRRPLRTANITNDPKTERTYSGGIISNQGTGVLAIGAEVLGRFSVAAALPITYLNTNGVGSAPSVGGAVSQGISTSAGGIGDLRLEVRGMAYKTDSGSFRAGLGATFFVSTGNATSFLGDGNGHTLVQAMFEEKAGPLIIAENLGYHFRSQHDVGDDIAHGLHFADEMTFGVGVFVPIRDNRVRLGAEVYGQTGTSSQNGQSTFFKSKYTPLEWLGEARFNLGQDRQWWVGGGGGTLLVPGYSAPDFRLVGTVGYQFQIKDTAPTAPARKYIAPDERIADNDPDTDGDGLPDSIDACPTIPEDHQPPNPNDGCPAPSDRDHDGIPDDRDKCPDVPEDRDGIDDEDGCPEDDVDKDGIPDAQDACPREPGKPSPDPKQNGCPKFIRRVEGSTEIQILQKIEFDTGKASIKSVSFPILDEVVDLMKANPNITKLSVEGHTDSRGKHDMNEKLSADRAASVVKYVTTHGVDGGRLSSQGFGPDKPIDTNDTDTGRQKNRRVEFHIVSQN